MKKSDPMVLGFFRAQIRLGKKLMMKKKKKKQRVCCSGTSSMMISAGCDDSIQHNKRKLGKIHTTSPILLKHRGNYKITSTDLSDLPVELLGEVLKRLPVKYLLRCRCVNKSWNFLIKTPTFITLHTNHHKFNHNRPKYHLYKAVYHKFITIRFDDTQVNEYCRVKYLPEFCLSTRLAISHGLICVTYPYSEEPENKGIHLWNPLVGKYTTLPPSPFFGIYKYLYFDALAFGFLPEFNDYVVVQLIQPGRSFCPPKHRLVKIAIYSLNNNSWKTISQDYFFRGAIKVNRSVFANGVAYWLGFKKNNCEILVCFDTKTDTLREILLPDWVKTPYFGIHTFGQSIAFIVEYERLRRFDMWVLKGDKINELFWEKKMSVKNVNERCRVDVLGLRNNGEPIVFSFYDLLSYNLDSHKANDFVDSWNCWDDFSYYDYDMAPPFSISPFVESLALLNLD